MSYMGLLRTSIGSSLAVRTARLQNHVLSSLLREPLRRFSTGAEQPPQGSAEQPLQDSAEQTPQDPAPDPFLQSPSTGLVYGKLLGIRRNTLKTDVLNMLEGCNLTLDDLKVEYYGDYTPMGMVVQFPSRKAYDNALKVIAKNGRLYKLDRYDRSRWDILTPYNGKTVLLQGLPQNALPEDVDRFLCGCDYDASSLQLFYRSFPEPLRLATVRFHSKTQAMNAFILKNRGFCLNNRILMRVLQ